MASIPNINTMIISISDEYRKVIVSILENNEVEEAEQILESWDSQMSIISTRISPILKSFSEKKEEKKAPKRPISAYIYFCKEKRPEVKEANPDMKATDVTKELGLMWKEIKDTEEANQYIELAKADKERYISESGGEEKKEKKTRVKKEKNWTEKAYFCIPIFL